MKERGKALANYLWIPALIFMLGILVYFHEFGHFVMAKLLKIKVEEFAFGFGPRPIRLFKRGDTEYTIHPIPLGGFVKLAGENPGEPVTPGSMNSKPWYQRYLVYLAGPLASFLLAYLIFCGMGMFAGVPSLNNRIDLVEHGSRAEAAGLRSGDRIVRINGSQILTGDQLIEYVHKSIGKELTITIDRGGKQVVLHATPGARVIEGQRLGILGFRPSVTLVRVGLISSVVEGTKYTKFVMMEIKTHLISKNIANEVGGPIAIASATRETVRRGIFDYIQLVAALSLSLGLVNLLPIPIMDGGQMVITMVEGIIRRRLSMRTLVIAQMVGLAAIGFIFISVMYLDLGRLFQHKLFTP